MRHGQDRVETARRKLDGESVKAKVDTGARLVTPEYVEDYFEDVRGKLGGTGRGLEG